MVKAISSSNAAVKRLRVQAYPVFEDVDTLNDFLARAAWHFSHVPEIELYVPLATGFTQPERFDVPSGFDNRVQGFLDTYVARVRFQSNQTQAKSIKLLELADIVLKWKEGDAEVDKAVAQARKQVYRVDPVKVRQEGSFFIQCAFDLYSRKESAIEECKIKFERLASQLGRRETAWVMATGPSVEGYRAHSFKDSVVIVCNSVVLNDELMEFCKPSILVFADPIFHFGVSQYAGKFREVVEQRLATTSIQIVVPFKYYPLLVAKFPQYQDRIIGVPFEKVPRFNFDLTKSFHVKTTANILTLLLLPVATTFADRIRITGCDGRPLEENDYFWGHGKSVQINDKMENIQVVHPGFFAIDYNEYYFEHCHTLENLIIEGEMQGKSFIHEGLSHIPALRDRGPTGSKKGTATTVVNEGVCVVLEPDGMGREGHYVRWHTNLIFELKGLFEEVHVLCNKKQDSSLYPCSARPTFTSFSWGVSRSDQAFTGDFFQSPGFSRFAEELYDGVLACCKTLPATISIYIYYGSVQILKAIELLRWRLLKEGCQLKAFVCLFHESVILDSRRNAPRFHPKAKDILLEAVAQVDNFRIASVTQELADLIYEKFEVRTEAFTNPVPALSDKDSLGKTPPKSNASGRKDSVRVLFPTNPRDEKGKEIIVDFLNFLNDVGVPEGHSYLFRGECPPGTKCGAGISFLGDHISDEEYWLNLQTSDVIVVPYLAPCFTYRTSGILVDAIVSEVPSVVLSQTWLGGIVDKFGVGISINYRSPLSIMSAIKVIAANHELVMRRIRRGKSKYLKLNSWRKTAEFMLIGPQKEAGSGKALSS